MSIFIHVGGKKIVAQNGGGERGVQIGNTFSGGAGGVNQRINERRPMVRERSEDKRERNSL